jgi:hypothetical protein
MEASLSDSNMFQQLNKSSSITTKIAKAYKTGVALTPEFFEEQYLQIQKTHISPIAERILKAYDDGKIKLVYNKNVHISASIPFVVMQIGGKSVVCIFISDFSGMNKAGTQLSIDMKKLYTLMESGYIGLNYFTEPSNFVRNASFLKMNASIYSQMVLRILNREYALSLEKNIFDSVEYVSARFFLEKVFGITNRDLSDAYARSCCNNPDSSNINLTDNLYSAAKVTTIEELIAFIAKSNPKMNNLTFRYFFERWIASFGTGACLAIDSYPYLYYVIANVLLGGFLVNVTGLSEIIKNTKGIEHMYSEISRIVR